MSAYRVLDRVDDEAVNHKSMVLTDSQSTNVLRRTKIILSFAAVIFTISTIVVAALRSKRIQYDHPFMELIPICRVDRFILAPDSSLMTPVPLVSVEFEAHSEYTNLTDPASTRLWQELGQSSKAKRWRQY